MRRFPFSRTAAVVSAALILGAGTFALASANGSDETESETTSVATASPRAPETKKDTKKPGRSAKGHHDERGFSGQGAGMEPAQLADMMDQLPENLRTDLAKALTAPDGERAGIIEEMLAAAKAGDYGKDIANQVDQGERVGKQMGEHAKKSWDEMPAELKADLEALRGMDHKDRRAAFTKITEDAKAGKYGEDVKQKMDSLQGFGGMGAHSFGSPKR